jgi:hypothetical protein
VLESRIIARVIDESAISMSRIRNKRQGKSLSGLSSQAALVTWKRGKMKGGPGAHEIRRKKLISFWPRIFSSPGVLWKNAAVCAWMGY